MKDYNIISAYHQEMESDKWFREIPYLRFHPSWKVKITPPFAGAVIRFRVLKGNAEASVYLDCYDQLGCYGSPYWEIYPVDGDVWRCPMNDTKELMEKINQSLSEQYEL